MADAIALNGLTRWYGTRRGVLDLDVTVQEGEVFGFLGPNGAGKTTTIRMLLGLIRPSSGTATIWGLDCWRDAAPLHRRLAHLGSDPGYLGGMTAGQTLNGIQVTPLTAMAQTMAQRMSGGMTDANITAANTNVGKYFMVTDVLHNLPMNPLASGSGSSLVRTDNIASGARHGVLGGRDQR